MGLSSSRAASPNSCGAGAFSPTTITARSSAPRRAGLASRKTILVLHLAGQIPLAGVAWQALHHVLGLRRLGHDVWYIEDSGAQPYDPRRQDLASDCAYNVAFLRNMMERFDLGDRWAYWD